MSSHHINSFTRGELMSSRNKIVAMTKESEALKKLRINSGKSLRKLADLMNLSFVRVHQMESGRDNVTDDYIEKFLGALKLNWDDWDNQFSGKDELHTLRRKCHDRLDEIEPSKLELIYGLLAQF